MQTCIACHSDNIKKDGDIEGYIQGSMYGVYSCLGCETKWSSPHVSDDRVYNLIYSHKADVPGYMRYGVYATDVLTKRSPLQHLSLQEETYYGVVKSVRTHVSKRGKILEVGCGLGYMTHALSKAGYEAIGLDISSEAINQAKEKYGDKFVCENFFNFKGVEGGYDAVCMLELIEHVEDPSKYIEKALSLLKPDGIIIITTPNRDWYTEDSLWGSDLPPVHLTWFSEKGMKKLAEKSLCTASHTSFIFYNLMYGSILKPSSAPQVNPSFFTRSGEPLFSRYTHSRAYELTNRLYLYTLLKGVQKFVHKAKELLIILISPHRISLTRSHTQCVVLHSYDVSR